MIRKLLEPNKYIPTVIQLLTPFALYLGFGAEWYWWVAAIVWFFLYRMIGHNVALHRFYTHDQFTTSKFGEVVLAWFALMCCVGSPLSYTIVHLVHHRYSDTDLDPHGPIHGKKSFLYCFWNPPYTLENTPVFGKRLLKLSHYMWMNWFYWPLIALQAFLFYLIDWKVFLFFWWIPVSLTLWEIAFSTYISHVERGVLGPVDHHKFGKWVPVHEYLHKVHHYYPVLGKHGDWDYTYYICKLFAKTWRMEKLEAHPK